MTVSQRFTQFLSNLKLTESQRTDGNTAHKGVRKALNTSYWASTSETANSMLVGSWGKGTEMRPPRDVDVLFQLPDAVYHKYQLRVGNRQSQLLQEVKEVLKKSYSSTKMRGDGQVVVVGFTTIEVEVVPAFKLTSGQYYICDTNGGGSYKTIDPHAEIAQIQDSNTTSNGNTRDLARMLKRWQTHCSVELKSFLLEITAVNFLNQWEHRGKSAVYYDYMVRDFFGYLLKQTNTFVYTPGACHLLYMGDAWKSKTETAKTRAEKACNFEAAGKGDDAGAEWQKIFGFDIPKG